MNTLKILGKQNVEGFEFVGIEGGFGEGKRAMLIKDIAEIHGKEMKVINQSINMNRKRFIDGTDIIDLKSVNQIDRDFLNGLGYSNSSIANANNIYILSERGYAKLLKILEDDVAWVQYEKLVDGYFNMRADWREKFNIPKTYSEALHLAADLVDKNVALSAENEQQRQLIGELKPKADHVDRILSCKEAVTITQIAADYNMSANALNKILEEERIQRSVNGQWILYKEHMNKGYTKSETIQITRADGSPDTKMYTKWTQKGRLMINAVLNRRGIYANMDLLQMSLSA